MLVRYLWKDSKKNEQCILGNIRDLIKHWRVYVMKKPDLELVLLAVFGIAGITVWAVCMLVMFFPFLG